MAASVEEVADAMYEIVKKYRGRKQYTARELTKLMKAEFGVDRKCCKDAIKSLMDGGRTIYTYKGSSYVELPPDA